jgi:CRISPR-associated protein Cas2
MLHIVTYDIPATPQGTRRRQRLARYLESLGLRVQWSVFELLLPPERLPKIIGELGNLIDPAEDSVRIYTTCAACADRTLNLGRRAVIEHEEVLVWA